MIREDPLPVPATPSPTTPITRIREQVDRFLHNPKTEWGLVGLIALAVALVIAEVGMGQGSLMTQEFHAAGQILNGLLVIELLLRGWVARRKRRFLRFFGLDIIAVLSFSNGLRLLRLLRLFRAGILLNHRFRASRLTAGWSLQVGILLVLILIILGGALTIFRVEGQLNGSFGTLEDSFWWSFLTLVAAEPIGGEPTTTSGRVVMALVMLSGLTMFAVVTGLVSAVMVEKLKAVLELRLVELDELRDHILICGWNRNGHLVIEELQSDPSFKYRAIVIVAEFEQIPEYELSTLDRTRLYVQVGDYTRINVLESVGIYHAAQAILLADATRPRSDQDCDARTVLAALTIEKLQPRIHTCAQLLDRNNNVQLAVAGVEDVVVGAELTSHLIATSARNRGLTDILTELLTVQVGNQFYKVPLPADWQQLTFAQTSLHVKEHYDGILVALERKEGSKLKSMVNPPATTLTQRGDQMVLIARHAPPIKR